MPKVGDRVRGVPRLLNGPLKGVVKTTDFDRDECCVEEDVHHGWKVAARLMPVAWDWEKLPDPEPEYRHGDVYRDDARMYFFRTFDGWLDFQGNRRDYAHPVRPLIRMVPEPKP